MPLMSFCGERKLKKRIKDAHGTCSHIHLRPVRPSRDGGTSPDNTVLALGRTTVCLPGRESTRLSPRHLGRAGWPPSAPPRITRTDETTPPSHRSGERGAQPRIARRPDRPTGGPALHIMLRLVAG